MALYINYQEYEKFKRHLGTELKAIVDSAIEMTKPRIHVVTGRLQASLRSDDPYYQSANEITVNLIAGGVTLPGIVDEIGIMKDVNYAFIEEVRHPMIRKYYPNALRKSLRTKLKN